VGKQATPEGDHLFKVKEDGHKLDEEQANAFHHTVYQLLFGDYDGNGEAKLSMNRLKANSLRKCVGEHTQIPTETPTLEPNLCIKNIRNFPQGCFQRQLFL
jgi:hypothetical protein